MGYTKPIETANAIYVLSLEQHTAPDFTAFEKYHPDFLAIEGEPDISHESTLQSLIEGKIDPKSSLWGEVFQKSLLERPLLMVDPYVDVRERFYTAEKGLAVAALVGASLYQVGSALLRRKNSDKKTTRRRLFKALAFFLASEAVMPTIMGVPTYFPGELGPIRERLAIWNDALSKIRDPVVVDARNAIIAEKLEQMAPSLRKELGRKPVILIHIGAGHHGISSYLRNPTQRVGQIRKLAPKIKEGIYQGNVDKCVEFRWNPKTRDVEMKETQAAISTLLGIVSRRQTRGQLTTAKPRREEPSFSRRELFGRFFRPRRGRNA